MFNFFSKKNKFSVSRAQIERLLKGSSQEHHISANEIYSIISEFIIGFQFLHQYKRAVSFYGSARLGFESDIYKQASLLASRLSKDGFAIITGGGPGIMEAANKGAYDVGGEPVGINIKLHPEQKINKYVEKSREFEHFFVRKTMLSLASSVYIFFPGGFGTLDELFEMIELVHSEKIPPTPIILVDKNYWSPLLAWIEEILFKKNNAIDKQDMQIYHLVNSADEAYELIHKLMEEKKIPSF